MASKHIPDPVPTPPEGASELSSWMGVRFVFTSPYDILGVPLGATEDEVKAALFALRKLGENAARTGDATANQALAKITDAGETLGKQERREAYHAENRARGLSLLTMAVHETVTLTDALALIRECCMGLDTFDPIEEARYISAVEDSPSSSREPVDKSVKSNQGGTR